MKGQLGNLERQLFAYARLEALRRSAEAQLKPVLLAVDFESCDVEEAF